jgi:hypothetical protein
VSKKRKSTEELVVELKLFGHKESAERLERLQREKDNKQ